MASRRIRWWKRRPYRPRRYSARLRDWPQRAGGHECGDYRRAVIGENSIVGASAFVKANAEMPANHLIIGSPAKAIRTLSEQELAWKNKVPVNTGAGGTLCRRCTGWSHGKSKQGVSGWRLMKTCGQKPQPEGKIMAEKLSAHCHCGAVAFTVELSDGFNTVRRCNCSYCRMRGAVAVSSPLSGIEVVRGGCLQSIALIQEAVHFSARYAGSTPFINGDQTHSSMG